MKSRCLDTCTRVDTCYVRVPKTEPVFPGDMVLLNGTPFVVTSREMASREGEEVVVGVDRDVPTATVTFARLLVNPEDVRSAWKTVIGAREEEEEEEESKSETGPGSVSGIWEREVVYNRNTRKRASKKRGSGLVANKHLDGTAVGKDMEQSLKRVRNPSPSFP